MSKVANVLIVGANRGLGLQLVKDAISELQAERVFATYRSEDQSKELLELASTNPRIHAIQLDARDDSKFAGVAKLIDEKTEGTGLNLLINNAGIYTNRPQRLESLTKETLLLHFEVNTIGPLLLAKEFVPLLEKASALKSNAPLGIQRAVIVNMSSLMGSVADNGGGGEYAYRASKAALNMVTKSLSIDLKEKNILSVVLHPGWVQTDMGGSHAPTTIAQSVRGMIQVISDLNESQNGQFLRFTGDVLPW